MKSIQRIKSPVLQRIKSPSKEYPKLMISTKTGVIILFSNKGEGTVVFADKYNDVGHHSDIWNADHFENLDNSKEIILNNE